MRALTTRVEMLERQHAAANPNEVYLFDWTMPPAELATAAAEHERAGREVVVVRLVGVKPSEHLEADYEDTRHAS